MSPSESIFRANAKWPGSNISSSGITPAARICPAITFTCSVVLISAPCPKFRLPISKLQISGFSATTCRTRSRGGRTLDPAAAVLVFSRSGTKRPPGPVVRFSTTSVLDPRIRSDDFPVQVQIHAGLASIRITHMDVDNRSTSICSINRASRDLTWGDRQLRMPPYGIIPARDRASQDGWHGRSDSSSRRGWSDIWPMASALSRQVPGECQAVKQVG